MQGVDSTSAIAIVGVAALFPGSVDRNGFWRDILAGRDLMTDVPASHWLIEDYYDPDPRARDKTYAKRGAFLPELPFDAAAWGVPPQNLPATDTAQLLALIVAQQVLEDACRGQFAELPRDRTSVILGVTSAQELLGSMVSRLQRPVWVKALREQGLGEAQVRQICDRIASHYVEWQESTFPGVLGNVVAGRIANRLDLRGTNCVTDAACASSLSALSMAVAELRLGESDLVITGGVDTMNDIFMYVCFSKTPALSPTGDCRPFSDQADGTMLGEGIGMFALRRLADAERDGNRIYAVIKGVGSSSDGRAKSVYAPLPAGQVLALERAYAQAGYGPDSVGLVEAHGTGTRAGDAAEFEALRQVFEQSGRSDYGWCALGSVKSQIGHTKAAAGAAGLFKATLALSQRVLPPTIKLERPDPKLGIATSPFFLNTRARPWVQGGAQPRRASVSAFGFGGSNFHVALEEYKGSGPRALRVRGAATEVLLLGAATAEGLSRGCRELAERLSAGASVSALARASQQGFDAASGWRLLVLGASADDLSAKLAQAAERCSAGVEFRLPERSELSSGPALGTVGFVFPGQGSQYLNMGLELSLSVRAVQDTWDETHGLRFGHGEPALHEVVYPKPVFDARTLSDNEARLQRTEWAQPAIGALSLATLAILQELGVQPSAVAGHSFGEVSALCAAGVVSRLDLLRIARQRGELMAAAATDSPGAMLAVAASSDELRPHLADAPGVVIANHNAPRQVVLSGPTGSLAQLERRLSELGLAVTRLPVACAFHSPIVSAACAPLRAFLDTIPFRAPVVDVYAGGSGQAYPREPDAIRELLARQLAEPVRFIDQIEAMYAAGVRTFVELGPGSVLSALVGKILGPRRHRAIALNHKGRSDLTSLNEGLGQLSLSAVPLAYDRLWADFAPEPELASGGSSSWMVKGSSYGKPYPPPGGAAALPPANPEAAARAPAAAAPAAEDPALQLAWLAAFQETQRQTVECHQTYQRLTAEAHAQFLRGAESSLASLNALLGGTAQAAPAAAPSVPVPMAVALGEPRRIPEPPAAGLERPPVEVLPVRVPLPSTAVKATPVEVAPVEATPVKATPVKATPVEVAQLEVALSAPALEALALRVVAACTGYPEDSLGLDQDLEGDLGVDSIKRVEILSALRKQAPALPDVAAEQLASQRSIRQIVALYAEQQRGASNGAAAPTPAQQLERWVVRRRAAGAIGLGTPGLFAAEGVVVTDEGSGIGAALVALLSRQGARARLVEEVPADAGAVIFLGGLRTLADRAAALAVHTQAFRAFQAVAAAFSARGGTFVTVQDTGGDFGLAGSERAWLAGVPGLAKTAAREWPKACVRALDLERGELSALELANALWQELCVGGAEREVGLTRGGRCVLEAQPARLELAPSAALRFDPESVVVVSGGGRGVTSACVVALAEQLRCRFLLLGRTSLAPGSDSSPAAQEVRQTLAAVEAAGGRAQYQALDVADTDAVQAALAGVRERGPIAGLVHGAGVLADQLLTRQSAAEFERVFRTKVLGLEALLEATRADELQFLLLFSSLVARVGNPGQGAYALANEVLNKVAALAQRRRGPACRVRALGFGPWQGGMVDAGLRRRFEALGVPLIPLAAGARQICRELGASADSGNEVILGYQAALVPAVPRTRHWELCLDAEHYPFLDAHRIDGVPVVPVALVLEWFARAVRACWPDASDVSFKGVHVRRGIRLLGYAEGQALRLHLRAEHTGTAASPELRLALFGADATQHYVATAHEGVAALARGLSGTSNGAHFSGAIYSPDALFHGPAFQVIERIESVSDQGMVACLSGVVARAWPGAWLLDPALLDGGLQLALLWARHRSGRAALPTAIGAVHAKLAVADAREQSVSVTFPVRCSLTGREEQGDRMRSDLAFVDAAGRTIAELHQLETHFLPAQAERAAAVSR